MEKPLDLLIVHPGAAHGIYGDLGEELTALEPPLWPRLIAGYVRDRGHSVKIIDAEAARNSPADVAGWVTIYKPRLVCIAVYGHQPSASTQQMHAAGAIARQIRRWEPRTKIIMVGGHVSALPGRTMVDEDVDYVCVGEGPITIERLLAGDQSHLVPGLAWRTEDDVIARTSRAPLIEDLSALHGDTWDLLPMHLYRPHNWQVFGDKRNQPYASIYTSLGCPYACSFCCINAPFGERRYRMRPPADVVEEVRKLHDIYNVRTFKIIDEMFVLNPKHYGAICEGLAALPFASELNIWAYSRIDTVRPDKLALLRRAGIRWLALGIESSSSYVRDGAEKQFRGTDIEKVVRQIQAAGINVIANYIVGLPDDDAITMEETYQLAARLNTEFMNIYSAMAYPGSPLFDQAVKEGWTLPSEWRGYSQHNEWSRPLDTRYVHGAKVLATRDKFFTQYFSRPEYKQMLSMKFGETAVTEVEKMLSYPLKRRLVNEMAEAAE